MKFRVIFYNIKATLKRRSTIVLILSILFLVLVINGISLPFENNVNVGIMDNNSNYAKACISNMDSMYSFITYEDIDKLNKDIVSGKIECGFIFDTDFDKRVEKRALKNTIEYIYSPYTTKGLAIKESIFSSFLKLYSESIISDSFDEIFVEFEDENMKKSAYEELINKNNYYLNSNDIFAVDFSTEFK